MRLTVLGNADRYLAPGSRGSGYLVETDGGARILLDCGGGIADALPEPGRLDALVISHFHHDHVLDFLRLLDAFPEGMPIFVPPGQAGALARLGEAFAFRGALEPPGRVIDAAGGGHRVGDAELRFAPTRHSAPSVATRIGRLRGESRGEAAPGRGGLVYASDTAPCDDLAALARGCDLLLAHTLLPRISPGTAHAQRHMTAEEAARIPGPRRLLLSHRYHESKDEDMLDAAPGALLARAGASYVIGT